MLHDGIHFFFPFYKQINQDIMPENARTQKGFDDSVLGKRCASRPPEGVKVIERASHHTNPWSNSVQIQSEQKLVSM